MFMAVNCLISELIAADVLEDIEEIETYEFDPEEDGDVTAVTEDSEYGSRQAKSVSRFARGGNIDAVCFQTGN